MSDTTQYRSSSEVSSVRSQSNSDDAASQPAAAMREVKRQVGEGMEAVTSKAKKTFGNIANEQMENTADLIESVAAAFRSAADDLASKSPQLSSIIRSTAENIDDASDFVRNRSAEEVFESAASYVRQRPGLIFAAAGISGFLAFQFFKLSASSNRTGPRFRSAGRGDYARSNPPRDMQVLTPELTKRVSEQGTTAPAPDALHRERVGV